jgi:hypothetical protein
VLVHPVAPLIAPGLSLDPRTKAPLLGGASSEGLTDIGGIELDVPGRVGRPVSVSGGGLGAGLTAAAAIVRKGVIADVTIFERRDTAIPLQLGCDTRWVHPHIYDWPPPGSEARSIGGFG